MTAKKRLMKELYALVDDPPPGLKIDGDKIAENINEWVIDLEGAPATLYEGESFKLGFKFSDRYPFDSPQVMFVGDHIPTNPHVYTNGHICLSILTDDWSPALTVETVCLSVISMLSSCTEKKHPPDNQFYVMKGISNPKKTRWWYHDDSV